MNAPAQPGHNQSIGERCHDALVKAANAKSLAERRDKMRKRKRAHLAVGYRKQGASAAMALEEARDDPLYHEAEDEWFTAMEAANLARAEAEGLEIRFKEWQAINATTRAEMNLR